MTVLEKTGGGGDTTHKEQKLPQRQTASQASPHKIKVTPP